MNIQNEAVYRFLKDPKANIPTKYLKDDFQVIVEKSEAYLKNKGEMPSPSFLFNNVKKLSDDKEQVERLEDLLYSLERHKQSDMSHKEVSELLLEEYKKDELRELTKKQTSAIVEERWLTVDKIAKQMADVSNLQLNADNFLENDIKKDIHQVSTEAQIVDSGIFSDMNYSLSQLPVGSMILIIGKTGLGKSLLSIFATVNNYLNDKNEIYISYEMPKQQVMARIYSYLSAVPIAEIIEGDFVTEDGRIAFLASKIVLQKKIDIKKAIKRLKKNEDDKFEDIEDRTNYLKIVATADAETFKKQKELGIPVEELPNDVEILNMIREYGDTLDDIVIDLVSEVNFSNKFASTEQQLTVFGREAKALALLTSTNVVLVSQPENEKSASSLIFPKYSKSLRSSCDMNVLLLSTAEMREVDYVAVCVEKCRHNKPNRAYICETNYETMTFTPIGDEMSLDEVLEQVGKEMKKKNDEKK